MPEEVTHFRRPLVVIDDDPDALMLLRRTLMKSGIAETIVTFAEPAEALDYLDAVARTSDAATVSRIVVLCDLKMPGLDGFAVLRRIRTSESSTRMGVIIISSCALEADVERARALGADGYLEKMPSPETLAACIALPSFAATGSRSRLFESWEASQAKAVARASGRSR